MQYSLIDNAKYSEQSIYFSKSYLNIFSRIYKSNFKYLKIEHKEKNAFIPLIIRKLDSNNYEAFSLMGMEEYLEKIFTYQMKILNTLKIIYQK